MYVASIRMLKVFQRDFTFVSPGAVIHHIEWLIPLGMGLLGVHIGDLKQLSSARWRETRWPRSNMDTGSCQPYL